MGRTFPPNSEAADHDDQRLLLWYLCFYYCIIRFTTTLHSLSQNAIKETPINTFSGFKESFASSAADFRWLEIHRFALISVSSTIRKSTAFLLRKAYKMLISPVFHIPPSKRTMKEYKQKPPQARLSAMLYQTAARLH